MNCRLDSMGTDKKRSASNAMTNSAVINNRLIIQYTLDYPLLRYSELKKFNVPIGDDQHNCLNLNVGLFRTLNINL